jgi:hypothetical protein
MRAEVDAESQVVASGEASSPPPERASRWAYLACIASFGLSVYLIVAAYEGRRSFGLLWLGLLVAVGTCLVVVLRLGAPRSVKLAALFLTGAISYLPKVLASPHRPLEFDEALHIGQAQLLLHGQLFGHDPVVPTMAYYPVYQLLLDGIHYVTTLSLWTSDLLLAGVTHSSLVLLAYLAAGTFSRSERFRLTAAVVYLIGPAVLLFSSQAAYGTVGNALVLFGIYAAGRAMAGSRRWIWITSLTIVVVVATQALASLFLAGLFFLLAVFELVRLSRGRPTREGGGLAPLLGFAALAIAWNLLWAAIWNWGEIWAYLLPGGETLSRILAAFLHPSAQRHLFRSSGLPTYARICGYLSVVLVLAAAVGAFVLLSGERRRASRAVASRQALLWHSLWIVLAALFFLSLPFDLSPYAIVWVHRSWPLLWIGLAFLVAYAGLQLYDRLSGVKLGLVAVVALMAILLVGNTAISTAEEYIFPIRYRFDAGAEMITRDQLAAARWMRSHHPKARFVSDPDSSLVEWVYGGATPVPAFPTWDLTFPGARLGIRTAKLVEKNRIGFLVVDKLMYHELSQQGPVYNAYEPHAYDHERPIPVSAYTRLTRTRWIHLVYENRQMAIFRLEPRQAR